MTPNLENMTNKFSEIKNKRDKIKAIENLIRPDFEKNVINFFKEKGFDFKAFDNKYDPINRYRLEGRLYSTNFILIGTEVSSGKNVTFVPQFNIVPWDFTIRFEWHKAKNQSRTQVYWHPEEMSLEDFYNKKLKKVFNLI